MARDLRYLILAEGQFGPMTSKTANGCIRYSPERVLGVLDTRNAGKTAQDVLGFGGDIPVFATLEDGLLVVYDLDAFLTTAERGALDEALDARHG